MVGDDGRCTFRQHTVRTGIRVLLAQSQQEVQSAKQLGNRGLSLIIPGPVGEKGKQGKQGRNRKSMVSDPNGAKGYRHYEKKNGHGSTRKNTE